jgi:DNA polymerase-3 subunit gamma/tau
MNEEVSKKTEKINYASPSQTKDDDDLFGIKDKAETIGQLKNIAQEKDIKIKDEGNQKIETTDKTFKFI